MVVDIGTRRAGVPDQGRSPVEVDRPARVQHMRIDLIAVESVVADRGGVWWGAPGDATVYETSR
jgi:hypothetical protein